MVLLRISYLRIRPLHVLVSLFLIASIGVGGPFYGIEPYVRLPKIIRRGAHRARTDPSPLVAELGEKEWIVNLVRSHNLDQDVDILWHRIHAIPSATRPSMLDTGIKFNPRGLGVLHAGGDDVDLPLGSGMSLPVAGTSFPEAVNASSLLVGLSTTFSRVSRANYSMIDDWAMWMTDRNKSSNGANLVLSLHKSNAEEVDEVQKRLDSVGIDAVVMPSEKGYDMASIYIRLITHFLTQKSTNTGIPNKSFIVLIDDDIHFPNMGQLMHRLSSYDTTKELYLGLPSERTDWVIGDTEILTYGGGAVILSLSAASLISEIPCTPNDPSGSSNAGHWTILLQECITKHTSIKQHVLPSFYSPLNESYALQSQGYETGLEPLTLHHAQSRHRLQPAPATLSTSLYGDPVFLQRYRFTDNWILIHGFSLFHYPDGQRVGPIRGWKDLSREERVYAEYYAAVVDDSLVIDDDAGPRGDTLVVAWAGPRRRWMFVDSGLVGGRVAQAYLRRRGEEGLYTDGREGWDLAERDSLVVLVWEPFL